MSGWFALVRTDGAPVEDAHVDRMLATLRVRGPHGEAVHRAGACALGLTVLDTRDRTPLARAPVRVGPLVGVGEVRVDARDDVLRTLGIGRVDGDGMSDLELFVRAFERFGDAVIERVGGEHGVALFHEGRRELVLCRDGFGVRQLFHASVGPWVIASNSLSAVRDHPAVSGALDDDSMLDFLLFDWLMDKEKTAFRDIGRLHPGHVRRIATDAHAGTRVRDVCSWELTLPAVDTRSSVEELGLAWRDALDTATNERLAERTGLFLSGGIDSTGIAASAVAMRGTSGLHAITAVSSVGSVDDDPDGRLATLVARHLGIAHETVPGDGLARSSVWSTEPLLTPEPVHDPYTSREPHPLFAHAASAAPVALDGEGGDEIWRAFAIPELRTRMGRRALSGALLAALARGVLPDFRTGIVRRLLRRQPTVRAAYPTWLAPAMDERARARWERGHRFFDWARLPGERAVALTTLINPMWAGATFARDPDMTGLPLEVRFPLLDRRVVDRALRVPSLPGCTSKHAARTALAARLPTAVVARRKTGIDDTRIGTASPAHAWEDLRTTPSLGYYVDVARAPASFSSSAGPPVWEDLRPLALARWLRAWGPA